MKIWEKHLLYRLILSVGFINASIFFVFSFVDLAIHSSRFGAAPFFSIVQYCLCQFSLQFDLFFSLSLLLSCIKVLLELTQRGEAMALQTAGISRLQLSRPFWILALSCSLLSCMNAQWVCPAAFEQLETFRNTYAQRKKTTPREHFNILSLQDGSELVYQRADSRELIDVFWIQKKEDEIWHFRSIELSYPPQGYFLSRFAKNSEGVFYRKEFVPTYPLSKICFPRSFSSKFIPFGYRSLSSLAHQLFEKTAESFQATACFYYKCTHFAIPLFIAALLPFVCLRYNRKLPILAIVSFSLFAFIAYQTILEGIVILVENGVLSAGWGFLLPPLLGFTLLFFLLLAKFLSLRIYAIHLKTGIQKRFFYC